MSRRGGRVGHEPAALIHISILNEILLTPLMTSAQTSVVL